MALVVYNSFKVDLMTGAIDLDTDVFYLLLVTSTYTPNQDTHTKRSDITNEVANGGGYTTKGKEVTGKAVTVNNTTNEGILDGDDVSWTNSTITARAGVLYKYRGGLSSADELVGYYDYLANKTSDAGTFLNQWDATGILALGDAP